MSSKTDSYIVRQCGTTCTEIVSPLGKIVAWATDPELALVIVKALNNKLIEEVK